MSKKDDILYGDSQGHMPHFTSDQQMQDFTKRYRSEVKKMNDKNADLKTPLSQEEISSKAHEISKEGMNQDIQMEKAGLKKPQAAPEFTKKRGSKVRNLFKKQNQNSQKKGRGR
jgi:hypothetical protein